MLFFSPALPPTSITTHASCLFGRALVAQVAMMYSHSPPQDDSPPVVSVLRCTFENINSGVDVSAWQGPVLQS